MLAFLLLAAAADAPAIAEARSSLIGRWTGKLEYRDYQADKWFGLPDKVEVRDGGDGVTLIRTSDYDDGPKAGNVRITTVSMLAADGEHETSATFRKGRAVELQTAALTLAARRDAAHWTLVETIAGTDDDRPATLRLTTTRDGASLVTLKEVDFTDDAKAEWLARNRTTLTVSR
ncbi:MAG: hypothetical protein JOZ20_04615 [Sphingomonas sp.]|nr:hypothetical protein [Sphingomonas sp.]